LCTIQRRGLFYKTLRQITPSLAQVALGLAISNPSYNRYLVSQSFNITKITFNWTNSGYIIYGSGTYVAAISTTNNSGGIIATSVNSVSMGCFNPNCTVQSGEFDFVGQTIPAKFYLDFYAVGGGLQGGNNITVSNVEISGSLVPTGANITINSNVPTATFSISPTVAGNPSSGPFPVVVENVPSGQYTVEFNPVSPSLGYGPPAEQTQTATVGSSIT
jgi:hypothetical protein